MIPTFDHDQIPTANDFRIIPQMVLTKNAEIRRLALQKVIIFLVYFSSPAWQREEVPCSTRDLQAAFSPLLASVTDAGWFSLRVKLYVVHGHLRRTQLWTECVSPCDLLRTRTHALRRHCSVTWGEKAWSQVILFSNENSHEYTYKIWHELTPLGSCCCEKKGESLVQRKRCAGLIDKLVIWSGLLPKLTGETFL